MRVTDWPGPMIPPQPEQDSQTQPQRGDLRPHPAGQATRQTPFTVLRCRDAVGPAVWRGRSAIRAAGDPPRHARSAALASPSDAASWADSSVVIPAR